MSLKAHLRISFFGSGWNNARRSDVFDAVNLLEAPRKRDGVSKHMDFTNIGDGDESADTELRVVNDVFNQPLGLCRCRSGDNELHVNYNYCWQGSCPEFVWGHEILHAAGAEHGGRNDSFQNASSGTPDWTHTATCFPQTDYPTNDYLNQDDLGWLAWRFDQGPNWAPMNGDSGFENNYNLWESVGAPYSHQVGAWFTNYGADYARVKYPSLSSANYLQSKVGVLTEGPNIAHRATARVRMYGGNVTGEARLTAFYRELDFTGSANSCSYEGNLDTQNPNGPITAGSWMSKDTGKVTMTQSWKLLKISPAFGVDNGADAHYFAVRLEGVATSTTNGAPRNFYIDNLQMEVNQ